ncbi:hypothetical protein NP233_g8457 [Leucocoprinus birnbaumii]|uniref:F-box domain-containing protein n=1 Tax=Leucocoprinus birnbaumii TaxID=56174 RepID=A0AAD5YTV1_9AGAR|nr:hypothetical protein NP233_g8457 [Leucocoprinus birnbaumii]
MLLNLPPELLISILKHLSLADISACIRTSKLLKELIEQHESTVYRQAAAHPSLRLIPHDQVLFSEIIPLGLLSSRYLGGAKDWKALCRRAREVHSCWLGKGPSHIKDYYNGYVHYPNVHRIKVDERRGFIITTHGQQLPLSQGRVVVSDIDEGRPIWGLDSSASIREYLDPEGFEVVPESMPDEVQLNAIHVMAPGARLKFVPHALLRPPDNVPTRAFRFVYPTLLVAATNCLLLWDVRTGRLVERMDDIVTQMPHPEMMTNQTQTYASVAAHSSGRLGRICYVEVNDKYALVCGDRTFKVFHRGSSQEDTRSPSSNGETRSANCVMAITRSQLQKRGRWNFSLGYVQSEDLPPNFEPSAFRNPPREMYNGQESESDASTEEDDDMDDWFDEEDDDSMDDEPGNNLQIIHVGLDLIERRRQRIARSNDYPHPRIDFWRKSGKVVVTHQVTQLKTPPSTYLSGGTLEYNIAGE